MLNIAGYPIRDIGVNLSFGGMYLGGQRKFWDERPFTCKGNYLVLDVIKYCDHPRWYRKNTSRR